ncbi:hypothetical protein C0J52_17141 [Blattella germanica]|nr:hypothetical protein C0J52_17141 [Blattella germanica]
MEMRSLLYIDVIHLWWIPLVTLMLLIYNLRSWIRTAILVSRLPGPPALPLVGNVLQFYNSRVENWQKHRKIINPTFHMRVLENFVPVFVMNSKRMVAAMKKFVDSCEAFDVTEFSFACTLDIICETTMGTPVNAQDCNLFRDFSLTAVIAHDILIHRLLKPWLLLDSFFKFTEGSKTVNSHCFHVDELSDKVVQRRRETMKASKQHIIGSEHGQKAPSVFLDSLLKLQEEGYGLSDAELINEVKTIIMAVSYHMLFLVFT